MPFADDVVLVNECRPIVNRKLELWRKIIVQRILELVELKQKYMRCDFNTKQEK